MALFSPQSAFLALGAHDQSRQRACRALSRARLNQAATDDIRLALNLNQPLGNSSFMTKIARVTGERREARPRGRPRKNIAAAGSARGQRSMLAV